MHTFLRIWLVQRTILAFTLLVTGCAARPSPALEPVNDPNLVVVRIKSHGASGSIIATTDGKSWILSCAHMFYNSKDKVDQNLTQKKIVIDGPVQPYAPKVLATTRLLAIDADFDLSLIEIDNGPFNYMHVAPQGYKPGRNIVSAGYDEMKWPITNMMATILVLNDHGWLYTREKPWHGRSGGGLFDIDGKVLIGVVNGYEMSGQKRGIYVSHDHILRFMATYKDGITIPARPPLPINHYRYSVPQAYQPSWQCLPGKT